MRYLIAQIFLIFTIIYDPFIFADNSFSKIRSIRYKIGTKNSQSCVPLRSCKLIFCTLTVTMIRASRSPHFFNILFGFVFLSLSLLFYDFRCSCSYLFLSPFVRGCLQSFEKVIIWAKRRMSCWFRMRWKAKENRNFFSSSKTWRK